MVHLVVWSCTKTVHPPSTGSYTMARKPSDDSILSDAEDARERERTGKVAAGDQYEHTYEEVKDAPARAKAAGATEDRVKQLEIELAELRKMMSDQMKMQVVSAEKMKEMKASQLKRSEIPQCPHCEQYITVCGGLAENHVTLRVLPDRPEHMESFPGVIWNNVTYVGVCVVPKVCASDILAAVKNWTEYKFNLGHNRGRVIGRQRAITEKIGRGQYPIFQAG